MKGRAKLAMGHGVSTWLLEAPDGFGDAGFHSHHAIQLTVCLSGELALETRSERIAGNAIGVAADATHRFRARGLLAFIFVEPESAVGRTISAKLFADKELAPITWKPFIDEVRALGRLIDAESGQVQMLEFATRALDRLAPINCTRCADPRVQRIIDFAQSHLDQPLTLETAADGVYLSPSRLRHLFVEQTGLAFRTYMLWLRLMRAVELYSSGVSLTDSAHAAGFADSAHFSRIFKRTFGLPATTLSRV